MVQVGPLRGTSATRCHALVSSGSVSSLIWPRGPSGSLSEFYIKLWSPLFSLPPVSGSSLLPHVRYRMLKKFLLWSSLPCLTFKLYGSAVLLVALSPSSAFWNQVVWSSPPLPWRILRTMATVLGSIPASSDTVESEGRQMKQYFISYIKRKKKKNPPLTLQCK